MKILIYKHFPEDFIRMLQTVYWALRLFRDFHHL